MTKPKPVSHSWYLCNACGMPQLKARDTKPRKCAMTPQCKGQTVNVISSQRAADLLGVPVPTADFERDERSVAGPS